VIARLNPAGCHWCSRCSLLLEHHILQTQLRALNMPLAIPCCSAQRGGSCWPPMPARRPPKQRRRGLARLLPDELQAPVNPALPYPGLQHGCDPEAAARAALLVEQGYGALEPWLSAEPEPMTLAQLAGSALSGPEAYELWRRQQQRAARQEQLLAIDWG